MRKRIKRDRGAREREQGMRETEKRERQRSDIDRGPKERVERERQRRKSKGGAIESELQRSERDRVTEEEGHAYERVTEES